MLTAARLDTFKELILNSGVFLKNFSFATYTDKDKLETAVLSALEAGTNRHGERNGTVGFVREYGKPNSPAKPWMTIANEKSTDEALAAMMKIWEEGHNE